MTIGAPSTRIPPPSSVVTAAEVAEAAEVAAEIERRGWSIDEIIDGLAIRDPQTDDELWQEIHELTGYRIPRVAVCEGHVAPFDVFADVYFCRLLDVLLVGSRGSGKTAFGGFLHGAKCRHNPGYKSFICGATDKQANRGYAEFKRYVRDLPEGEVLSTLLSKTVFRIGSLLEIAAATLRGVNGPHPHLAQFDELELVMTHQIFEEFQNMAQGDAVYPSQNLLTSTRKFVFGLIQRIVKDAEEAIRQGDEPEWQIRIICVFEVMAEVPNCQRAPKKQREARLTELGMDPCSTCECHKVRKGEWDDRTPRTFDQVCDGKAFRSRGFQNLSDVTRRFKRLSREVFEAQQLCKRPDPSGLVHKWFDERYIIPAWFPYPEYGDVIRTWDFGSTNPSAVHYSQLLSASVRLEVDLGELLTGEPNGVVFDQVIPEGSLVTFDETYIDGLAAATLAQRVLARQKQWAEYGFPFKVKRDVYDPAARQAKLDVEVAAAAMGMPVDFIGRAIPRVDSVDKHREWGGDGRLYIVGRHCPNAVEEYAVYHYPKPVDGKNLSEDPVKEFDHAMDGLRMGIWYLHKGDWEEASGHEPPSSLPRPDDSRPDKRDGMRGALGAPSRPTSPISRPQDYLDQPPVGASVRGRRGTR